jgi:hypothetical protein
VRKVFIFLLAGYKRLISPLLPSACRFYPTCSQYMSEAIELHGAGKGIWLGLKRLGRCHPFHEGGTDLVPRPHAHSFGLKTDSLKSDGLQ